MPLILPGVVPRVLGGAVHDTPAVVMMSATVLSAVAHTWYVLCSVGVEVIIRVTDISVMAVSLLVSEILSLYHPSDVTVMSYLVTVLKHTNGQ